MNGKDAAKEAAAEMVRGAVHGKVRGGGAKGVRGVTGMLLGSTVVMLLLVFPPFYGFFLAPVALVPLCVCVLRRPLRWRNVLYYWAAGAAFYLLGLFWLAQVDVLGYIALSLYVGVYFAVFAVGVKRLVVEMRLPATVAVPLVWTGVEYIRTTFVQGGFPWFMLGNCLTPWPVLIQAADLFGVWGLTFLLAMLNGVVVDVLRLPLWVAVARKEAGGGGRRFSPAIARLVSIVGAVAVLEIGYGVFRLAQHTTRPGPRVAVIQENIPQSIKQSGAHGDEIFSRHLELTKTAAEARPKPDLIAWPETMLPGFGNTEFLEAPDAQLRAMPEGESWLDYRDRSRLFMGVLQGVCDRTGVPLLVGTTSFDPRTNYSDSIKQNRTMLLAPQGARPVDYYAKVHLVPFGEYLPFRRVPVVGKYMIYLSPVAGEDFSNVPGEGFKRFKLPVTWYSKQGRNRDSVLGTDDKDVVAPEYTFGTPICFEDMMPYPSRHMTAAQEAGGRKGDFLVNVSNDGWFAAVELDQHLQACQLRAVENRVPIARSVNTGNSGFIDSNGRIVKLVVDGAGNSTGAVGTESWVMALDSRVTFYSRIGDLFPIICGIMSVVLVAWTLAQPRRGTSRAVAQT